MTRYSISALPKQACVIFTCIILFEPLAYGQGGGTEGPGGSFNPFCIPGTTTSVTLPEVRFDLATVKSVELEMVFDPLQLTFTKGHPSEPLEYCRGTSNTGTLDVFLEVSTPNRTWRHMLGTSTASATVKLFHATSGAFAEWSTSGFSIRPLGLNVPGYSTGRINSRATLRETGATATYFDSAIQPVETYFHETLSQQMFGRFAEMLVFEDPGSTEMLVTDQTGRKIGGSGLGMTYADVPGGVYIPEIPLVVIPGAEESRFNVDITGITSGDYSLKVGKVGPKTAFVSDEISSTLAAGESERYFVDLEHESVSLESAFVDADWSWHNFNAPFDVDSDGIVSPLDAILVINELGSHAFTNENGEFRIDRRSDQGFLDVDLNYLASPYDAVMVINALDNRTIDVVQVPEPKNASNLLSLLCSLLASKSLRSQLSRNSWFSSHHHRSV